MVYILSDLFIFTSYEAEYQRKLPKMIKKYISEANRRVIEWTEGGRIIHKDLSGKVVGMEDHSKTALTKIIKFLDRKTSTKTIRQGSFNAVAKPHFVDMKGLDIECIDGTFHARRNDTILATNKLNHQVKKAGGDNLNMYIRSCDEFKPNMRYAVEVSHDGSIEFVEFEEIRSENLNARYDEPILNIYEVAA